MFQFDNDTKLFTPARSLVVRELMPPPARAHVQMRSHEMFWQIIGPDGRVVREADCPVHNLILNQGTDTLAAAHGFTAQSQWAVVGTGPSPVLATHTGMTTERPRTQAVPAGEGDSTTRVSNGVYNLRRVRQFTAAEVGGHNLTHWGFSAVSAAGANLMCMETFRDGAGNPITLTPAADQQLRIIYISRVTVGPVVATAGSINITNIGERAGHFIVYGNVGPHLAALSMLNSVASGVFSNWSGNRNDLFMLREVAPATTYDTNTNDLAAVHSNVLISAMPYTTGSRQRTMNTIIFGANDANFTIRACGFSQQGLTPDFRGFTAAFIFNTGQEFTKNNLHELHLTGWGVSWS